MVGLLAAEAEVLGVTLKEVVALVELAAEEMEILQLTETVVVETANVEQAVLL
jgi:hypothetical protein